jgi:pilus assembly protein CpaE
MVGAKGGVGTTTIACNLAVDVRRQTQHKTLLADLDMDAGLVNFFMKSEARYSVMNSASHSHHTDTSCWEGIVAQSGSGLHIARSPGRMGATKVSDLDRVRHLITLWSGSYQWILLDLGRLNAFSLGLLDRVDELLLVSTTNAPALHEAKRLITTLQEAGFREDRLRLVVNQFGNRNGYEESDLDGLFGIPVYAKLPCAAQELHRAGANPNQLGEDNEFRGHIARLARKVAGLPNKQSKSKVSQMFSFADRFRKSDRQDSPARTA